MIVYACPLFFCIYVCFLTFPDPLCFVNAVIVPLAVNASCPPIFFQFQLSEGVSCMKINSGTRKNFVGTIVGDHQPFFIFSPPQVFWPEGVT